MRRDERRRLLRYLAGVISIALSAPPHGQSVPGATDITAAQVQQFLKDLPPNVAADKAIRVVDVGGYRIGVYGAARQKAAPGDAISHETSATEIYLILEGSGLLVTGGSLREPITRYKSPENGWTNTSSKFVDGGQSRHVAKGDIIVIPPHLVHQWTTLDTDITYLIFRPDPTNELILK